MTLMPRAMCPGVEAATRESLTRGRAPAQACSGRALREAGDHRFARFEHLLDLIGGDRACQVPLSALRSVVPGMMQTGWSGTRMCRRRARCTG